MLSPHATAERMTRHRELTQQILEFNFAQMRHEAHRLYRESQDRLKEMVATYERHKRMLAVGEGE
jgi:hypothetical protein